MELEKLKSLRKLLHEFPEKSFHEYKTAEIVLDFINSAVQKSPFFSIYRPFLTSIVVCYKNGGNKPFKLFRADMDALSVNESENNEIVSKNQGVMHACGHDIHLTLLCGLIDETAKLSPKVNLLFLFQPGEEGMGGAKRVIESGVFDAYNIESAYALHVTDDFLVGEIASNDTVLFAIPREIDLIFEGKTAHAAFPERGHDALAAAADFLVGIERVVRRKINPAETFHLHFGKLTSGTARNVVSSYSKIEGTLRAFNSETMNQGTEIVRNFASQCAADYGCRLQFNVLGEYVEVKNSPRLFAKLKKAAQNQGVNCIYKKGDLVGEDFGYFTKKWEGILFYLGARKAGKEPQPLHSATFFPAFEAVEVGLKIMTSLAFE